MLAFLLRPRVAATLLLSALATMAEPRAEAQFGIAYGLGGDPFLMFAPQMVPSPTDYLHNVTLNRLAAQSNAPQFSAAEAARSSENAYWNRIRDNTGSNSYDLASRRSLNRRVGSASRSRASAASPRTSAPSRTAAPAPAAAPAATPASGTAPPPPRPRVHPLEEYFRDGTQVDWPNDAPGDDPARAAADQALRAVLEQVRAGGKPKAQSVADARAKVIAFGQTALARVRAERSAVVANVFHYYLLFLNDTLLELGADES